MRLLTSELLAGFPHGFTTREGGVSAAPFDTLNLGGAVGDDPEAVAENWRRLERSTGLGFARVRQVHGARAVRLDEPGAPVEEADAVISARPGVAACVSVADCVPVLLADPRSGVVAAVGPSIGPCCYEVSADLAARFRGELDPGVVRDRPGAPHLDLWAANAAVLRAAGVAAGRIEIAGRCTACERELFFSHRRDAGRTGRQMAYISPPLP